MHDTVHALLGQLDRAREKWGRIGNVPRAEGATARSMGYFCKAIVRAILLYGSESWTLLNYIIQQFRSFHASVARYLTRRRIRCLADGTWFYPPTEEVLEDAGLKSIDQYIRRRRQTVRGFVRHRPLYEARRQLRALSTNENKTIWWWLD
jgi:hypothetical protein